ncbi:iron-siderophore ABC transporter substrate-binding protein [Martelella lutilitoris]|uniref:Iron-siderophore ABC transporter substrate-binding protein n=1 Tax=Martelella lutilitoris TaxID=2583532 RepID=A0A7T7KND7_9HYPH|nr:iron-siderophore ABC transporter substrate-binding protein [Martelella lutilitoris]QQM32448.1 iron-siderophore ABC transporter substrate-binding protein [Martelella lutilitoris]
MPFRLLAAALFVLCLAAGGLARAENTIEHAMGITEVPSEPRRVVTLTNETTEAALAVGVRPVGATRSWYGDPWYPHLGDRLSDTADLGTELAVNVELVAALEPDLIIGSRKRDEEIYGQLSAIAPTVFVEGLGAWKDNLAFVARALNRQTEGEAALASYEDRVKALRGGLGEHAGERVSVVRFVPGQTYLYLRGSFLGHVLADVGFSRPVQQQGDGLSIAVGRESIPDMDGDRIFWLTYDRGDGKGEEAAAAFLSDPLWARLPAVRDGRVSEVDDGVWATAGGWFAAQAMLDDLADIYAVSLPPISGEGSKP